MTDENLLNQDPNPLLIVLSGPSGAGKDAVLNEMRNSGCPLTYITTVTTRAKRRKERNAVDYHFVTQAEFQTMVSHQEFMEYANVYGNWYGVPKKPVKAALENGQDVIVKVDIQGATTIKIIAPEAVFIFLTPPSIEEIVDRLTKRRTESDTDLSLRVKTAEQEMEALSRFDYLVLNPRDKIDQAVANISSIIAAEKCRAKRRRFSL